MHIMTIKSKACSRSKLKLWGFSFSKAEAAWGVGRGQQEDITLLQHQRERTLERGIRQTGVKAFPELVLNGYSNARPLQSPASATLIPVPLG